MKRGVSSSRAPSLLNEDGALLLTPEEEQQEREQQERATAGNTAASGDGSGKRIGFVFRRCVRRDKTSARRPVRPAVPRIPETHTPDILRFGKQYSFRNAKLGQFRAACTFKHKTRILRRGGHAFGKGYPPVRRGVRQFLRVRIRRCAQRRGQGKTAFAVRRRTGKRFLGNRRLF